MMVLSDLIETGILGLAFLYMIVFGFPPAGGRK